MSTKKDKCAIVCGGSYGLGYEISKSLLERNFNTIILSRNRNRLKTAIKNINSKKLLGFKCDLSNSREVEEVFKKIIKLNKKIDLLICVAGNGKDEYLENKNYKNYYSAFQKNFFTAVNPIEILFRKNKNFNIIVIASIAGYFLGNAPLSYSLAKNSLINYCRETSTRFANKNVRINSISPGHIMQKGNLWHKKYLKNKIKMKKFVNDNVALKRFCKPSDIINAIDFLVKDENNYITGVDIKVDGKTR